MIGNRSLFKKRIGAATCSGQKYEFGLCGLWYLRLLKHNQKFQLANNVDECGAFDDIYIKNKNSGEAYYVQAKHKDKAGIIPSQALIQKSGNFSILKYYQSYCEIADSHGISLDKVYFILYTNSTIKHQSADKHANELGEMGCIISTGDDRQSIFTFGENDSEIWELECSSRYHQFLKRFLIFTGQSAAQELPSMIQKEVACLTKISTTEVKLLTLNFLKLIETWWSKGNYFLEESSSDWYVVLRDQLNSRQIAKFKELKKYNFKSENMKSSLVNVSRINLHVPDLDEDIRCFRLWDHIQVECGGQYLLTTVLGIEELKEANLILGMFLSGCCTTVIINVERASPLDVLRIPFPYVKKLILVSGQRLELPGYWHYIQDIWHLSDLELESQINILASPVLFQGEEVTLYNLCDRNFLVENICGQPLAIAMQGGKITLGSPLPVEDELYIPRTLQHPTVLQKNVLEHTGLSDVFAVSQLPACEQDRVSSSTVVLSSNSRQQDQDQNKFNSLRSKFLGAKNLHWLVYQGGFLTWKQSCGIGTTVQQFIRPISTDCQTKVQVCCHKDMLPDDWEGTVRVVTGQPGIGKSTLLRHVAAKYKEVNQDSWIIYVPLIDCSSCLASDSEGGFFMDQESSEQATLNQVVELLYHAADLQKSSTCRFLTKNLLLFSLQSSGKISVLIDAVDEVSPHYKHKVLNIVKLLQQETKVKELWVSARTVLKDSLVEHLHAVPLLLKPFSVDEQQKYLRKYLHQHKDVEKVVEFMLPQTSSGQLLCAIPLHAQLFADMVVSQRGNQQQEMLKVNLAQVYENFFFAKYKIYCKKNGKDFTKQAVHDEYEFFIEMHTRYALLSTFNQEQRHILNISDVDSSQKEELESLREQRLGIIDNILHGNPKFVHVSFSEYLVARWFKEKFQNSVYSDRERRWGGYEVLLKWGVENIRLMFDHILTRKCELHQVVLAGNIDNVERLIQGGIEVHGVDGGGRTALHLALLYEKSEIAELLLASGCPVNVCDKIMGWLPIDYADYLKSWHTVFLLLENGSEESLLQNMKLEIKNDHVRKSIISAAKAGNERTDKLLSRMYFSLSSYKPQDAVHLAIAAGNIDLLQTIIHCKECDIEINSVIEIDSETYSPLHEASLCGITELVCLLLQQGADINIKNSQSQTPLFVAAKRGHLNVVRLLIEAGADIEAIDQLGKTLLHCAAEGGNLDIVRFLLDNGEAVFVLDLCDKSVLHYAAESGNTDVVDLLIDRGGDIKTTGKSGWTVLHSAATRGHAHIIRLLIRKGEDMHVTDQFGRSILHCAAAEGHWSVAWMLTEMGADVQAADQEGRTVLHYAAERGHWDVVRLLLGRGANVEATDESDRTPLLSAAEKGHWDVLRVLVEKGADVTTADQSGRTILHEAVSKGNKEVSRMVEGPIISPLYCSDMYMITLKGDVDVVRLLIDKGADIQALDQSCRSALHYAAMEGDSAIVRLLIDNGADVDAVDQLGRTALHCAAEKGHSSVIRLLVDEDADRQITDRLNKTALHYAADRGHDDVVRLLIDDTADIQATDLIGNTALHYAAERGSSSIVKLLIDKGADLRLSDNAGKNALHCAAQRGRISVVRLLLDEGADQHITDHKGKTTLHYAAEGGHCDVVVFLIVKGANIKAVDRSGESVLFYAVKMGNIDAARLLIEQGADVQAKDQLGRTALQFAAEKGNRDMVGLLIKKGASVQATDHSGRSVLHYATLGHKDVVKVLIEEEVTEKEGRAVKTNVDESTFCDVLLPEGEVQRVLDKYSGKTALHYALSEHCDVVRMLIDEGANLQTQDLSGKTLLHYATEREDLDLVRLFLQRGVDPLTSDQVGRTALHLAAQRRNIDIVRLLLEAGADMDVADPSGRTALQFAAEEGNLDIATLLINAGANVQATDQVGQTVLHYAAMGGGMDVIGVVREKYTYMQTGDESDRDVLYCPGEEGDSEIVSLVVKGNLDNAIAAQNIEEAYVNLFTAFQGNWDIVRLMIMEGVDIGASDHGGRTALHCAAERGHSIVVILLLDEGADIEAADQTGRTALHYAAERGHCDVARLLLERGASIEATDHFDRTDLLCAAERAHWDIVREFIKKGADVLAEDKSGRTVLLEAVVKAGSEVIREIEVLAMFPYLTYSKCRITVGRDLDVIRLLINMGSDTQAVDQFGKTPLHIAVERGYGDVVKLLIDEGADMEAKDKSGRTPLHIAVEKKDCDIVRLLAAAGADLEASDLSNKTALHYATECGHFRIAKLLVYKGANLHAIDQRSRTPLHCAAERRYSNIVRFLIKAGANILAQDQSGRTAFCYYAIIIT